MSLSQYWYSLTTQSSRLVTTLPLGAEMTQLTQTRAGPLPQGGVCSRYSTVVVVIATWGLYLFSESKSFLAVSLVRKLVG